jgi:nicotinate-nucleotide--dimethylbenzimidazole phosphoribosyltransferase
VLLDLDPDESVGLGAGGDTETIERKVLVVRATVERARRAGVSASSAPHAVLAAVGGPEFAVLTGVVLGVASRGGAIVLDGFATTLCGLCAVRIEPGVAAHLVAGQRSRERGHGSVLNDLGLEPLLDLRLRAGEGVGAVFATQLLITALRTREITARVAPHSR